MKRQYRKLVRWAILVYLIHVAGYLVFSGVFAFLRVLSEIFSLRISNISEFREDKMSASIPLTHLFPVRDENNDRILEQLSVALDLDSDKVIYLELNYPNEVIEGKGVFNDCPVHNCQITRDSSKIYSADVVLTTDNADNQTLNRLNKVKQWIITVLHLTQNPFRTKNLSQFKDMINWTVSYRRDSVVSYPSGYYLKHAVSKQKSEPRINYAEGRSKLVAWFVTSCQTNSKRENYVRELSDYIAVDIYGDCGTFHCDYNESKLCIDEISKTYKFYLAFEDSLCKDYITEEFYYALK